MVIRGSSQSPHTIARWRWVVTLFVMLFIAASLAHVSMIDRISAQAAESGAVSLHHPDLTTPEGQNIAIPGKHLPSQLHDGATGSCALCGIVPAAVGPNQGLIKAGVPGGYLPPVAHRHSPPIPPPKLHA